MKTSVRKSGVKQGTAQTKTGTKTGSPNTKRITTDLKQVSTKILKLKILLLGSQPKIWRSILVMPDITFRQLHLYIQVAMGWKNYHMWGFESKKFDITPKIDNDPFDDLFGSGVSDKQLLDPDIELISKVFNSKGDNITYTYDYGDDWEHEIELDKFIDIDDSIVYPVCTDGENACPPEDSGGIWGYYGLLEAVKDKSHPNHKEYSSYLKKGFDPNYFNLDSVNKSLARLSKKFVKKPKK
ncbi:MAG: Plasmid pRiA4b ORF-3-like protein [Ignavibacteria bacterium]|nr:Plasmid pRiA4b ORF-3-like protein [Ignavibacteria bacterium]